jgi:dTMP kinase
MQPSQTPKAAPFLVFEGLDGSGKSTLIQLLTGELSSRGLRLTLTREPGGTPLAEEIRKLLLRTEAESPVAATDLLLYAASRAQHVSRVIRPALDRGEWVFCDRFSASTVAFQCFARGLSRADVDWLNLFAQQGVKPDLTILLDLTVDESRRRQEGRFKQSSSQSSANVSGPGGDRMEQESRDFHEAVRRGYLEQVKENPGAWIVLDASQSPEQMKEKVLQEFKGRKWLDS